MKSSTKWKYHMNEETHDERVVRLLSNNAEGLEELWQYLLTVVGDREACGHLIMSLRHDPDELVKWEADMIAARATNKTEIPYE